MWEFFHLLGAPSKGVSGVATTAEDKKASKEKKDGAGSTPTASKTTLVISGGEGYVDFRMGRW